MRSRPAKKTIYFDYTLLFIIIFLVCFGLVMLYSTSSYNAQLKYGDGLHYVKRQLFAMGLGFAAMFVVSKIDYHVWLKFSSLAYIGAIGLCVFVIFGGKESHGQSRWIGLGPLSFQPSEFAKIAVIIFLATMISRMPKKMGDFKTVVKVFITLIPILGPVAYTNLSTAIIIACIAVALTFVASPKYLQFFIAGLIDNLRYKARREGLRVVFVNPRNTSKRCPQCGRLNTPDKRFYHCVCGFRCHRDLVGAMNIVHAPESGPVAG